MPWEVPVLLRILWANMLFPVALKNVVRKPWNSKNVCWQFFFTVIFSLVFALSISQDALEVTLFLVIPVGFANSFAAYCSWRAVQINLSKTSVFTQADDITAITLGYLLLGETKYLNSELVLSIALCFTAGAIFAREKSRAQSGSESSANLKLLSWVAGYSFIWGVCMFLMRYFSLEQVSFVNFLFGWYSGSFLGSLVVRILAKSREPNVQLTIRNISELAILALCVWISLFLAYWAFSLAPVTVVQPTFMVSELVFPCLIGLYWFKEIKGLTSKERAAIALGITGGALVSIGF